MIFATSLHCMDGRIQLPLHTYLQKTYAVDCVDSITEPGICKHVAERQDNALMTTLAHKIDISVNHHRSQLISISGHHDCAGNPCQAQQQKQQTQQAVDYLKTCYPTLTIVGLWVDENWHVQEID